MKAHTYTPKANVAGWYASEKLDGARCFWDGGVSRGCATTTIPWANTHHPKSGCLKAKIKPTASGLWSNYGNPIAAPDWFLNQLPAMPLDGELWAGRGNYQLCMSAIRKDTPVDEEWEQITFPVFGTPPIPQVFRTGLIKNAHYVKTIEFNTVLRWFESRKEIFGGDYKHLTSGTSFESELGLLSEAIPSEGSIVYLHLQRKLPPTHEAAAKAVEEMLDRIVDEGGEGLVLRAPRSAWVPRRVRDILKYKPWSDAEGTVTGFTAGRETDKGSRLLGKIGALIVEYNGKRLELSGLTDEERLLDDFESEDLAREMPGSDLPSFVQGRYFKVGQTVTFKYRELSEDGIPKEARYYRKRDEV
jgi:DNA ligase-1